MNAQPGSLGFFSAFLDDVNLHVSFPFLISVNGLWSELLARLEQLLDDECAAGVVGRLLVGLLDDLNLHVSCLSMTRMVAAAGLAQVLDGDVDEPGAQRPLFLVRFLAIVLHGLLLVCRWWLNR